MRISDNRYNRDRSNYDLALRMMEHGAGTATIRIWTGLSDDRIRKLHRYYYSVSKSSRSRVSRRRGKAPRQPAFFLKSAALCFEATTLASLMHVAGLAPAAAEARGEAPQVSLSRGAVFCEIYETYLRLCAGALSFEHAWFLLNCLHRADRIKLTRCAGCGRLYLVESVWLRAPSCGCGKRQRGWPRRGRLPRNLILAYDGWRTGRARPGNRHHPAQGTLQSG